MIYIILYYFGLLDLEVFSKGSPNKETKNNEPELTKVDNGVWEIFILTIKSAFGFGFGDFKIDVWFETLLPKEYLIKTRGITRVFVGIQGLLSLILLLLSFLSYFGDPFNY